MKSPSLIIGAFTLLFFSGISCWGQNVQNVRSNDRGDSVKEEIKSQSLEFGVLHNVPYYSEVGDDSYKGRQCRLDIVYPKNAEQPFSTIVWFHGGGLTGGKLNTVYLRQRLFQHFWRMQRLQYLGSWIIFPIMEEIRLRSLSLGEAPEHIL